MSQRIDILGVGFDNLTTEGFVQACIAGPDGFGFGATAGEVSRRRAGLIVTPNPEIVMACRKNPELAEAVREADLVLPDGIGIIYGARILGTPLCGRTPGIDFAERVLARLGETGGSVFLLGAKPGVAEKAAEALTERYGITVAGCCDGYFDDDETVIAAINAARPDLLFVCLGSPKQELWAQRNRGRIDAGFAVCLGGALDVWAGTVRRAPRIWQKLGLEWLYRLLREPRRIGRAMQLPAFGFAALGRRLFGKA